MLVSGRVSAILARKKVSTVWSIGPNATVIDAIRLMDEKNVGALPVVENGKLVGIVSERDYTRKVILKGRSSKDTPVSDIMTKQVLTVNPSNSMRRATAGRPPVIWKKRSLQADTTILPSQSRSTMATLSEVPSTSWPAR